MRRDLTGLSPGWYRGCTMGNSKVFLGTVEPPEAAVYDCCEGYTTIPDGAEDDVMLRHSGTGLWSLGALKKRMGVPGAGLCDIDPRMAQPNERCRDVFEMPEDLCCTYLERCDGGACPGPPVPPFKNPECPPGTKPVDVGYDSHPWFDQLKKLRELWKIQKAVFDAWLQRQREMAENLGAYFYVPAGPSVPGVTLGHCMMIPVVNVAAGGPYNMITGVRPAWMTDCTLYQQLITERLAKEDLEYWSVRCTGLQDPLIGQWHSWVEIYPKDGIGPVHSIDPLVGGPFLRPVSPGPPPLGDWYWAPPFWPPSWPRPVSGTPFFIVCCP